MARIRWTQDRAIACFKIVFIALLIVIGVQDLAAASDVFSIKCETDAPARPYFVSFDLRAGAVVFESPPTHVTSYWGINLNVGTITSTADNANIEFTLQVISGKIDLVLRDGLVLRDRKWLIWPGIEDRFLRPTLTHSCSVIPIRSILSFRSRVPIEHPISVRCDDGDAMYFTVDVASKQALFERGERGQLFEGSVAAAQDDEIAFDMAFDVTRRVVWRKRSNTITIEYGNAERRNTVMQCEEVAGRTMLVYYDRYFKR